MLVVSEDCRWGNDWTWQEGLGAALSQSGQEVSRVLGRLIGGWEQQPLPWSAAISLAKASLDNCKFHTIGACRAARCLDWLLHGSPLG